MVLVWRKASAAPKRSHVHHRGIRRTWSRQHPTVMPCTQRAALLRVHVGVRQEQLMGREPKVVKKGPSQQCSTVPRKQVETRLPSGSPRVGGPSTPCGSRPDMVWRGTRDGDDGVSLWTSKRSNTLCGVVWLFATQASGRPGAPAGNGMRCLPSCGSPWKAQQAQRASAAEMRPVAQLTSGALQQRDELRMQSMLCGLV